MTAVVIGRKATTQSSTTSSDKESNTMSHKPQVCSKKGNALRKIDEIWGLHAPAGKAGSSAGCLAFVVDRRHVDEHGIEFRLAVSFGENCFPVGEPKGFLTPHPMPGKYCFGIHLVGTRGSRIGLFDQWYDAREANGLEDPGRAEEAGRAILAGISDDDYARHVSDDYARHGSSEPHRPLPVAASEPLALDDYEMVHDFEL
jgi:hypothetical protein